MSEPVLVGDRSGGDGLGQPIRTLVVGERFPWPQDHGAGMRLAHVIEGFALLGDVEFFALVHPDQLGRCQVPAGAPPSRVEIAARRVPRLSRPRRLAWLATGRLPLELSGRPHGEVRTAFRRWRSPSYDLAWFGDAEAYLALGEEVSCPSLVDFDDLEDQGSWLKGTQGRRARSPGDLERRLRHSKNSRLWRRFQSRVADSVAGVAVCSELDRSRLGLPGAVVIPNGYVAPSRPVGRREVGPRPTILFPGYLRYPPNIDAAHHLVGDIGPHLWARRSDLQIRLVGDATHAVEQLDRPPSVVVTGRVDDMAAQLEHADVVAVPLRHGGGTRIKILEAFAHRIPVVSTSIGAEGLDVAAGVHLLVADGPEDFAAACLRLVEDQALRLSLVESAAALFHQRYRWEDIHRRIAEVGAAVLDGQSLEPSPL